MNMFSRFSMWLQRVMYGRYGSDQLSMAILVLYLILYVVALIFRWPVLSWLALLLLFWNMFRMMSRNIQARYRENQAFLSAWRKIKGFFTGNSLQRKDKTHRYYKCPSCKNILRVPRRGKKIEITCPVCRNKFVKKA